MTRSPNTRQQERRQPLSHPRSAADPGISIGPARDGAPVGVSTRRLHAPGDQQPSILSGAGCMDMIEMPPERSSTAHRTWSIYQIPWLSSARMRQQVCAWPDASNTTRASRDSRVYWRDTFDNGWHAICIILARCGNALADTRISSNSRSFPRIPLLFLPTNHKSGLRNGHPAPDSLLPGLYAAP